MTGLPQGDAPYLLDTSYTITADVTVPEGRAEGMIVTSGGHFAGFGFYLLKGKAEVPTAESESGFGALLGLWVRPDGGYLIAIRGVDSSGGLHGAYANPRQLPFAKAEASREGNRITFFLELSAGGYNGSTYTLTYDSENDILRGVYYRAVARQRFDVYFERAKRGIGTASGRNA